MPDTRIYRHWFGTLIIFLAGTIPMSVLFCFMCFVWEPDDPLWLLAAFINVVIGLATAVLIYTFTLSRIDLNDSGIQFTKYSTLFASSIVEADWNIVQPTQVNKGLFGGLFGFGTLTVETADGHANLTMTYVSDVDQARKLIDDHATVGGPASV